MKAMSFMVVRPIEGIEATDYEPDSANCRRVLSLPCFLLPILLGPSYPVNRPRLVQAILGESAMTTETRRSFNHKLLGSLAAYGLIETLFNQDAFTAGVKPVIAKWFAEMQALSRDLKVDRKLKDTEFQSRLEALYRRVDLPELLKLLDLDKVAKSGRLPDNGARNVGIDLSKVEGLPARLSFGKQIFCLKKGRSVVPHGHSNMCTGFIILQGTFEGKHYDRVEDHAKHYLIRPTINRGFRPGEFSTISDHKDNIHWFKATSETGFIFNMHVLGYDPTIKTTTGRLYLDPEGEKVRGGLILARKMTSSECHKKYG
jgi:hypothetical protein